ncbi:hypothetical protein Ate01nite_63830 [Actinoplanes teichomyceticus]|nr:hypothetical protein Ate01nite_63830 [Actinoplanes teichomyceticus]
MCPVETLYVGQRSRGVLSSTVRGHLDTGALATAFDEVTRDQPSMRTRIVAAGDGFALAPLGEDERPRLSTVTGDLREAYARELNTALPVGGPVSRAVLTSAPTGDEHMLVISLDHTIIDGHSAVAVQNEVWNRYRALVEGRTGAASAPGGRQQAPRWPQPISELLPDTGRADTAAYLQQRVEHARKHPVHLVAYDAGEVDDPHIEVVRLTLDDEHTTRLRHTARRRGVSVHALICAALLSAARRRLDGDEPRTLGCLSPVDLRSRVSPPVPALRTVPAVTTHLQTLEVATDADRYELARTVHTRLGDFVASRDYVHEMRITPQIPGNPTLQLATVIATNMGVCPAPRPPRGLELVDVRLVPAREQYFPQAGRSPIMACAVSFDGRLAIEFPFFTACFSPSFMRTFRNELHAGLVAFADAAEPAPAPAG